MQKILLTTDSHFYHKVDEWMIDITFILQWPTIKDLLFLGQLYIITVHYVFMAIYLNPQVVQGAVWLV